uniref:Mitochondrial ribosome-associated GTPase 2 (inferred by orthology to a human protein) n=1 Tax=Strongyloides venezuelensis TaxID=75913 RepID=A0A0K0FVY1_STRVS
MRLSFFRFTSTSEVTGILGNDRIRLSIKAGSGGNGLARYNGIGGNGGDIIFIPKHSLTFDSFLKKFIKSGHVIKAENGVSSTIMNLVGKHGKNTILDVPIGVECINNENQILVARCDRENFKYFIARGGWGGCAANNYQGRKGDKLLITLHLKIKANVGFLGLPNAGKSTLLKALVPKKPIKIAPYPFTTLKPQVCHYKYSTDEQYEFPFSLTFADLPGLIEGAHANKGRGHEFLKHLEYSDIIAMIVDVYGFSLPTNTDNTFRNPLECISILNQEIEKYDKKLLRKPIVLVLNKIDLEDGDKIADSIIDNIESEKWLEQVPENLRPNNPITFKSIIKISAKKGKLNNFQELIKKLYDEKFPLRTMNEIEFPEESDKTIKII